MWLQRSRGEEWSVTSCGSRVCCDSSVARAITSLEHRARGASCRGCGRQRHRRDVQYASGWEVVRRIPKGTGLSDRWFR
ncbi:hypothetical protein CTRI78_v001411 [Colletotrichum trifolii]|uniref:Uncharacterized protein n=1 Tax=Colletotrichum trifolii TaxID=5466 RepID=A0A4R8RPH9_COLTR|nr:hypothetical protein CTRI78_v001411 [Colletotrichum trifolii]